MSTIRSFRPIANKSAHILILGSMPSVASLNANQYYAHPRNAFWRIMANIFKFSADLPYEARVEALKVSGVALWDVLHSCARSGSLDSAIEAGSRVPNNFQTFFKNHPNIQKIGFNGAEAEKSFNRYVLPNIISKGICFIRLPSSSPAHAVSLERKIEAWRKVLSA
jgi:double-stranded uracil-DNA glycosylase